MGVVADARTSGFGPSSDFPQVYYPATEGLAGHAVVRLAPGAEAGPVIEDLRRALAQVDPAVPLTGAGTMEGRYRDSIARERFTLNLLAVFAAAAVALAAAGLYGVVARLVGRRTREVGIRISLGAPRVRIFASVLLRDMTAVGVGALAGAVLVAASAPVLSGALFGVETGDPVVLAGALGVLLTAGLAATWVPARRAARIDPVEAMRAE